MPKTKRSQVISMTRTSRKSREDKSNLIDSVRTSASSAPYVWLFSIGNMRNNYLKEVRQLWKGEENRICFGNNRVMAKAMGEAEEDEVRAGIAGLSKRLSGNVGLLFTDSTPAVVGDWFATHERRDYARSGNIATETIVLPEGPIYARTDPAPETLPGSIEPQLRKLGLPTELRRGVPCLRQEMTICREGKSIDSNAAQVLKHLCIQQASFRIVPLAYYDGTQEKVVELDLTAEDQALVRQANPSAVKDALPGTAKERVKRSTARQAAASANEGGVDMDDDDDDDDDDDEGDDDIESPDETGGDAVTDSMMLPTHLR